MKVVITGGTGFLGLRLARAILARGALCGASGEPEPVDKMILFDSVTPPERPDGLDERVEILSCEHPIAGQIALPMKSLYLRLGQFHAWSRFSRDRVSLMASGVWGERNKCHEK